MMLIEETQSGGSAGFGEKSPDTARMRPILSHDMTTTAEEKLQLLVSQLTIRLLFVAVDVLFDCTSCLVLSREHGLSIWSLWMAFMHVHGRLASTLMHLELNVYHYGPVY